MSELEHVGHEDCMRTVSGILFNLVDPTPEMISWRDIGHSLSMLPRYGGHTRRPYPVAHHCVEAARLARADGCTPAEVLAVLLHDAAEAYIGDIISPVKRWFYELLAPKELRILEEIHRKAGIANPESFKDCIEHYDAQLFVDEVPFFFPLCADDPTWRIPTHSPDGRPLPRRIRRFRRYKHFGLRSAFLRELTQLGIDIGPELYETRAQALGINDISVFAQMVYDYVSSDVGVSVKCMHETGGQEYLLIEYANSEKRTLLLGLLDELFDDLEFEPHVVKVKQAA